MASDKINKKYYVIAWVALVVACFVRNAYNIVEYCAAITDPGALRIVTAMLAIVFSYGAVPSLITFLCAWVVWRVGVARYVRCISRKDFCCLVIAFTAAVRFVVGIIDIFSILEPNVAYFTTNVLDMTLLTGAMLAMFFAVIVKMYKFNPVEKYNAYKLWATIYMVVAGLAVIGQNGMILLLSDGSTLSFELRAMLFEMGVIPQLGFPEIQIAASITAVCVYVIYLVVVIVLGERLNKQAKLFRDPETRGEFYENHYDRGYTLRSDADAVFGGSDMQDDRNNNKKDNVFDEFDI